MNVSYKKHFPTYTDLMLYCTPFQCSGCSECSDVLWIDNPIILNNNEGQFKSKQELQSKKTPLKNKNLKRKSKKRKENLGKEKERSAREAQERKRVAELKNKSVRERKRMNHLNSVWDKLRDMLPQTDYKFSKFETIEIATIHIETLLNLLADKKY